jgi:hypothetical protein
LARQSLAIRHGLRPALPQPGDLGCRAAQLRFDFIGLHPRQNLAGGNVVTLPHQNLE